MGTTHAELTSKDLTDLRRQAVEARKKMVARGLDVAGFDPKRVKKDDKGNLTYTVVGTT